MAVSCKIQAAKIKINRQGGSDNFYVSWALTSAQNKKTITKYVYDAKKKKTVSTTKKFPDVIDTYTVKWYYKVSKNKNSKWYLHKTISDVKTMNTSTDLWTPPPEARKLKVTVEPIAKSYKKNKNGATAKWFDVGSTAKYDTDYDEYPQVPSIGEFEITGKTLKAQVIVDMTNFDRLEKSAVRLQVLRNGGTMLRFTDKKDTTSADKGEWYVEKKYTKSDPIPASGIVIFKDIELETSSSYQVRGAVASYDNGYKWSEYSAWSSEVDARPNTPTLESVEAIASDQVKLKWSSIKNATGYIIEYSEDEKKFTSGAYQSVTVDKVTTHVISGLQSGHKWWFRVRSVNDSDQSTASNKLSVILGVKPSPPTTWSSTNVASIKNTLDDTVKSEPVYLYWVHNSVDGSAQRTAEISITIGNKTYTRTKDNDAKDDYGELIDKTSFIELWDEEIYTDFKTSDSTSLTWKVRTKGVDDNYSDWSIERTIEAYEKPSLTLTVSDNVGRVDDIFHGYPLTIKGEVTPASQKAISFYISIIAGDGYTAVDKYGDNVIVTEGSEVYSGHVDLGDDEYILNHEIKASDIDIMDDKNYEIRVVVYTDAGLNCEATKSFKADWDEVKSEDEVGALIDFNERYRYAKIRPFYTRFLGLDGEDENTEGVPNTCYFSDRSPDSSQISGIDGDMYFNHTTGDLYAWSYSASKWEHRGYLQYPDAVAWYGGTAIDGESDDIYPDSNLGYIESESYYFNTSTGDIFKCVKSGNPDTAVWEYVWNCYWEQVIDIANIELAVYRKEIGGSYVTIQEGIDNAMQSGSDALVVTDYHPSFGECTYRIVATNTETGTTVYDDIVEMIPETSVIIQWDETWDIDSEAEEEGEVFEGCVLELPANIKLSDSNDIDVNFAEYIGRSRPVSYYGTQKGEKPSISCEFDKEDRDRLALLRKLMHYRGDVYIREPSGLGYWANVSVSYNKDYSGLTIPVTLNITPVEGGM